MTGSAVFKGRKGRGRTYRNAEIEVVAPLFPSSPARIVPRTRFPPGDIQADSVALCGGNLSGDVFWVSTTVDRRLQWIEARASFNLCASNYLPALEGNLSAQPAPAKRLHTDNGNEFLNAVIYCHLNGKWPNTHLNRFFPGHKNSNAHIEQKNGAVIREHLGDRRICDPALRAPPSPRRSAPPLWGRLLRDPQASLFPHPSVLNQMNNANPTFFPFGVVSI